MSEVKERNKNMEEAKFTLLDVVKKLTGQIGPMGDSGEDNQRLENLKLLCQLTECLIQEIQFVSPYAISGEHSVKLIGEYAEKFLNENIYGKV